MRGKERGLGARHKHCPVFDKDRRKTEIRLRELRLRGDSIWARIKKAGGPIKDANDTHRSEEKELCWKSMLILAASLSGKSQLEQVGCICPMKMLTTSRRDSPP